MLFIHWQTFYGTSFRLHLHFVSSVFQGVHQEYWVWQTKETFTVTDSKWLCHSDIAICYSMIFILEMTDIVGKCFTTCHQSFKMSLYFNKKILNEVRVEPFCWQSKQSLKLLNCSRQIQNDGHVDMYYCKPELIWSYIYIYIYIYPSRWSIWIFYVDRQH